MSTPISPRSASHKSVFRNFDLQEQMRRDCGATDISRTGMLMSTFWTLSKEKEK
jgi:hypothetical protein